MGTYLRNFSGTLNSIRKVFNSLGSPPSATMVKIAGDAFGGRPSMRVVVVVVLQVLIGAPPT